MKKDELNYFYLQRPEYTLSVIKNLLFPLYVRDYGRDNSYEIRRRLDDIIFIFDSNPMVTEAFIANNIENLDAYYIKSKNTEYKDYCSVDSRITKKINNMLESYIFNHFDRDVLSNSVRVIDIDFDSYSSKNITKLNEGSSDDRRRILERQRKYKLDCMNIGIEPITNSSQVDELLSYKKALIRYKNDELVQNTKWGKRIKKEIRSRYNFNPNNGDLSEILFDNLAATTAILKDGIDKRTIVYIPLIQNIQFGNLDRMFYHEVRHAVECSDHHSGIYDFELKKYNFLNELRVEKHALEDEITLGGFVFFGKSYSGKMSAYEPLIPKYEDVIDLNSDLFDEAAFTGNILLLDRLIGSDYLERIEDDLAKSILSNNGGYQKVKK